MTPTQPNLSPEGPVVVSARSVAKSFAGVTVLDAVSFDLRAGEVHSLMGENGAGKSTLLKLLAGIHHPDRGQILLDGRPVRLDSPVAALRRGIALIHQEPLSFPELTVTENVVLAAPSERTPRTRWGSVDWARARRDTRRHLEALGVDLSPDAVMSGLSIADQQMVELAAALSQDARVLLMDEPTAALTPREVDRLFDIVRRLRQDGKAIVFVSHRLPEVMEISDRITVLRDGAFVATKAAAETDTAEIIRLMVGRELSAMYERVGTPPGEVLLEVSGLTSHGAFEDVSLTVRAGEIVGVAGLVGAGRTEVAEAIFGVRRRDAGTVRVSGRPVEGGPRDAIAAGVAYVPEDRARHGLLLPMSIAANAAATTLHKTALAGWLRPARERANAERWRSALSVRCRDVDQSVRELSGGNQQKVVLGKWLETDPRVLILDEPTRGVDVGAKAEIHHHVAELARQGRVVLMISSDLPEVLAMSDRVVVMREGRITAELSAAEATQERVMRAATVEGGAADRARTAPPLLARIPYLRELGTLALLATMAGVGGLLEPRLLSPETLGTVLLTIPLIVVVAMGQMLVVVSRNIDLSVGSTLALAGIAVGNLYIVWPGMPVYVALPFAATVGGAVGLLNGTLVAALRVPAIIATLGTLTAVRGLVFIVSEAKQVDNNDLPASLISYSQTSPLGVPWLVLFALAVSVAVMLWLRSSRTGREVFAVGSNPQAARLRGVPVTRVLMLVFTITGILSGVAGLMFASRFGFVNPGSTGSAFELVVISAVVIGGVNVFGGAGTVPGVLLGCLLLGGVYVGLPMVGVSAFWQPAIYGLAILVATAADATLRRATGRTTGHESSHRGGPRPRSAPRGGAA